MNQTTNENPSNSVDAGIRAWLKEIGPQNELDFPVYVIARSFGEQIMRVGGDYWVSVIRKNPEKYNAIKYKGVWLMRVYEHNAKFYNLNIVKIIK